ncbi:MAG TPA: hypothetical protein VF432_29290 [Thermoanaerobaculia bacterium]
MNLGKLPSSIARDFMPTTFAIIDLFTMIALWIFNCIALNVFTLIRSNFGERFMTFINWFIGASMFSTFTLVAALAGSPKTMFWRLVWGPAVFFSFLYHRWVIRKRNRAGLAWHSHSDGISHLTRIPFVRTYIPEEIIEKWLEPALILIVALLMAYFDRGFSTYLALVALALCLRAQLSYNVERQQALNERDQRIQSQFMEAVLADRPPEETAGFTIAASNRLLYKQEAAARLREDQD